MTAGTGTEPERPRPWGEWIERCPPWCKLWFVRWLARVEWWTEVAVFHVRRLAFLDLLERVGKLAILVTLVTYLADCSGRADRARQAHQARVSDAWMGLYDSVEGGGGGLAWSLRRLLELDQSLELLDLSGANLAGTDLSGLNLRRTNLARANLRGANLDGVDLSEANLSHAILRDVMSTDGADFNHANLHKADLRDGFLTQADLQGAIVLDAVFWGSDMIEEFLNHGAVYGDDGEHPVWEYDSESEEFERKKQME